MDLTKLRLLLAAPMVCLFLVLLQCVLAVES
jgi:hypothetical protein